MFYYKHVGHIIVISFIEIIFTDRTCVLQNVPILHSETVMEDQKFERYLVFPVDLLEVWKVNKAKQTPRLRTDWNEITSRMSVTGGASSHLSLATASVAQLSPLLSITKFSGAFFTKTAFLY